MNRIKTVFAAALALVIVAAMAFLPRWMAGMSDALSNEKPGSASIQSVELALHSDQTEEPGYMLRKLALEQRMKTIPIQPEQANLSKIEAITAALKAMEAYEKAGVFEWFEYTFSDAEPYLGVDPENKNNNSVFWGVTFSREEKPYHNLLLHVDDETGKILYLSYETYGTDAHKYYEPENQRLMMEDFVDAFFTPLDLASDQMREYKNLVGVDAAEQALLDDAAIVEYNYEDAAYGNVFVTFMVSPNGLRAIPGRIRS